MAKLILIRDAERAFNYLEESLNDLENNHFENYKSYSLYYYVNKLKLLKSYIDTIIMIDSFDKKIIESIQRFEVGYKKIEYLNGNIDYNTKDNNEQLQ